jgi:hypothetical protein
VRLGLILLCLVGCGVNTPIHTSDGGGGNVQTICPAHPEQCGGTCCGTECLDTSNDPRHCGDCTTTCGTGMICLGGHCGCPPNGIACGMGQTCCGMSGCASLDSDIRNCGGCGHACDPGQLCMSGMCH